MHAESLLGVVMFVCLGMACEDSEPRSLQCPHPDQVQELAGVHYEDVGCEDAIRSAEARLTTAYYRKACEQLTPSQGVATQVVDAYVFRCEPATGDTGGSILQIQICCP